MLSPHKKLRIIVGGMVGQFPLGGVVWDYFHYVLGLHQLGHDVYYHEDTWVWPVEPEWGQPAADASTTVRIFRDFFNRHAPELAGRWHYLFMHDQSFGMTREAFDEVARTADLFINVSGACFIPDNLSPHCVKVWMDTDPGYNHIRLSERPDWAEHIDRWISQVRAHDRHLTYAENIHADDCLLPKLDLNWIPTRPIATPINWKTARETPIPDDAPLTTVMTWDYFKGLLVYKGVEYWGKPPEFELFRPLPKHTKQKLLLAVSGQKMDRVQLTAEGWNLIEAKPVTITPDIYQSFIASSAGEWSVAKHVFVRMRTGWFSCRTACYLASARPAVVQDTAWSKYIPSGSGVHAFSTVEEAAAGIEKIRSNPKREREAAYEIAQQYLSPEAVLPRMIDDVLKE